MSGPHPAVARVRAAVRADLAALGLPGPGSSAGPLVLVACSGGPDSLALAAGLAFVAARSGFRAGAVIVDHGLQEGSDAIAQRAAGQCRTLGLDPVEVVAVGVGTLGGPEAAARTARYVALEDAAGRLGAVAVLLGHTLDDQAETVLLALARGSGARSLSGMAPVRGLLRRPLLDVPRSLVHEACAALELDAWEDPTNTTGPNLRADVRHRAMPALVDVLGDAVPQALARTAALLREDADVLDALADELLTRARLTGAADDSTAVGAGIDVATLAAAPTALRRRAVRAALIDWGCPPGSLAASHVVAVDALVTRWAGQGPVNVPGVAVARRYGRLTPEIPS